MITLIVLTVFGLWSMSSVFSAVYLYYRNKVMSIFSLRYFEPDSSWWCKTIVTSIFLGPYVTICAGCRLIYNKFRNWSQK